MTHLFSSKLEVDNILMLEGMTCVSWSHQKLANYSMTCFIWVTA